MKKMHLGCLLLLATTLNSAALAQSGAKQDSTLESAGNKVTEPFDGKEVPQKLMDIQDAPYSMTGMIGSIIPFGGIIGEVTGANAERRRYNEAVYAGTVRRGFLKGVGLQKGCKAPARP